MKIKGQRFLWALVFVFFLSLILASLGWVKQTSDGYLNTFSLGIPFPFFDIYFINGHFAANFNLAGVFVDALLVYGVLSLVVKYFPDFSKKWRLA